MKYLFAILLLATVSQAQDTTKVPLVFRSDTTQLSFVIYRDNGFLKADSGYLIRSGRGSDAFKDFYPPGEPPKVEIFLSNHKRVPVETIWDLRKR